MVEADGLGVIGNLFGAALLTVRVLHVIPSISPVRGGPSAAVIPMCRALLEAGVDVELAATDDDGRGRMDVPVRDVTWHQGVPTRFFRKLWCGVPVLGEFQHGMGYGRWLSSHIRNFDIIHVHALFSSVSSNSMRIARREGIPYVLRPLGILEKYSLGRRGIKKRAYLALGEKTNLLGCSAYHLTSRREEAVSWLPGKARRWIVPLAVETPAGVPARGGRADVPTLLFLGRWDVKKRIPLLLEALAGLVEIPWRLVLAGAGDEHMSKRVEQAISRFGLSNRIDLPGFLTGADKEAALSQADLFVLPSMSENFGVAVAEAMVRGVPVVVTRGVALANEIEDCRGGWIAGEGVEELRSVLRTALENSEDLRIRGKNAADWARRMLTWRRCAESLVDCYKELLNASADR